MCFTYHSTQPDGCQNPQQNVSKTITYPLESVENLAVFFCKLISTLRKFCQGVPDMPERLTSGLLLCVTIDLLSGACNEYISEKGGTHFALPSFFSRSQQICSPRISILSRPPVRCDCSARIEPPALPSQLDTAGCNNTIQRLVKSSLRLI